MSTRQRFSLITLFALLIMTACSSSPAAMQADASATPIPPAATATQAPPTPEPSPTSAPTALPSPTLEPTATAVPALAMLPDGLSGWCLPVGDPTAANSTPDAKPAGAVDVVTENDQVNVIGEFSRCYFFAAFNQPLPDGVLIKFFDGGSNFYQSAVQPLSTDPNTGWALVDHTYLVNPPAWELYFRIDVVAVDDTPFYTSTYHVARGWEPNMCWNGTLPNPITLRCPLRQDLHPWDAGYGEY
ncbi:MAG: hypothetical protein HPY76_06880 [Anaerolineae bacterium]|nr:hypothetical protein [Anaerolineae bacterium]